MSSNFRIGEGWDIHALALLEDLGVTEVCAFDRRVRRLEPVGA